MRYRFGSFTLDADTWELRCDGEARELGMAGVLQEAEALRAGEAA